jgi:hypothetical protein
MPLDALPTCHLNRSGASTTEHDPPTASTAAVPPIASQLARTSAMAQQVSRQVVIGPQSTLPLQPPPGQPQWVAVEPPAPDAMHSVRTRWQVDPHSAQRDPLPVVDGEDSGEHTPQISEVCEDTVAGVAPTARIEDEANPTTATTPARTGAQAPSRGEHQSSTAPGVGHTEFDEDAIADIATVPSSNHKLDVAKEGEREKQNGKQQAQLQPHAKKRRGNLPADAVRVMKAWILRHEGNPYVPVVC